jgi:hypothetical protein
MVRRPLDWPRPRIAHVGIVAQPAEHANGQVAPKLDLTREAQVRRPVLQSGQSITLGLSHRSGVALDDLDPTRGAPRIPSTPVEDVDTRVLDAQHEAAPLGA